MSQYRPGTKDLLSSVRELLDGAAPQLAGELRYKFQVASYLLAICERQLTTDLDHAAADHAAWSGLLGRDVGDPDSAARELCAAIRAGQLDPTFDAVVEVVLARTIEDVRVIKPGHIDRGQPRRAA